MESRQPARSKPQRRSRVAGDLMGILALGLLVFAVALAAIVLLSGDESPTPTERVAVSCAPTNCDMRYNLTFERMLTDRYSQYRLIVRYCPSGQVMCYYKIGAEAYDPRVASTRGFPVLVYDWREDGPCPAVHNHVYYTVRDHEIDFRVHDWYRHGNLMPRQKSAWPRFERSMQQFKCVSDGRYAYVSPLHPSSPHEVPQPPTPIPLAPKLVLRAVS